MALWLFGCLLKLQCLNASGGLQFRSRVALSLKMTAKLTQEHLELINSQERRSRDDGKDAIPDEQPVNAEKKTREQAVRVEESSVLILNSCSDIT